MNLQVLVSTMHQKNQDLLKKMNIQSDAIIINQCDRNEIERFEYEGNNIEFLSFAERGIGLSRNNALMRATADICLFADDDVTYVDNYRQVICDVFQNNPKADVIVFNVLSTNDERSDYIIPKWVRLNRFNVLRYGTYRFAVRTSKIRQATIYFSLLFGGGARYSCGEDSLFISECIKKGLKVYACPYTIGYVNHATSTWFEGYTKKFFVDKGAFFACLSKRWAKILCMQLLIRHPWMCKKGDIKQRDAYQLMKTGIRLIKNQL